ncbi:MULTISPECIES: FecR domain-containing protein [Serratia]|uniref:FecR domain-containing protein n=1 Tax=Serratia TaxID=613 RepID=UPI000664F64A|nr:MULTISPECIES: FecR domain-containing protein [Serratia]EIV2911617.1 DUF4880 domain-containing protein [Serratia marcescens]MBH2767845.1 DUF4880 domain-containing protein [Serratia marcescens]MBH2826481.1 DUF4880 domain-containing protein [Serratia marcescens]MBH3169842.1 DUF4880 domain-containing protein [Serratia marcescens]MBH3193872.1 DUF4880 domain-containing protein [Serratia marcescens]
MMESDIDRQSAREAAAWLTQLMSEEASDADRENWRRWYQAKPENERAWRHIAAFSSRFSLLNGAAAQRSLSQLPNPQRRRLLRSLAAIGVVGTVGVGSGALPWRPWLADYRTAVGEQQTVALADGAQLMLNTQTAVNVSRQQATLLEGEMMVNLPPESGALTVRLPQGELMVQAARFSIRLWETYSDIAVYLGRVTILSPAHRNAVLNAGQGGRLSRQGIGEPYRVTQEPGWRQGMLLADNMRLDDFLMELGRYRQGVIRCRPEVASLRLSGAFPLADPERVIAALPGALPVRVNMLSKYFITVS